MAAGRAFPSGATPDQEGSMIRKRFALLAVAALLAAAPFLAAQSRTTEYHKTGLKIAKTMTFNITHANGYFVSGVVKDPAGAPVKDATVLISDSVDRYAGYGDATDAAGHFSIPVQPGNKILAVGHPSSASLDPAKFSRLLNKTVEGVNVAADMSVGEINLQNGYILSGKVSPPAGAGTPLMFTPVIDIFPPTGLDFIEIAQVGGTSGRDSGKYAVALPAGSYRSLTRVAGITMTLQGIPMLPRKDKLTISQDTVKNITMPKGGYPLSGTVKDSLKKGLNGALYIIPKSGPFKSWPIQIASVIKGVFGVFPGFSAKILSIPAGQYTLLFMPTGYLSPGYKGKDTVTYYTLSMPSAATTLALVAKNGVVVSGKTTDAGGKPVAAMVTVFKPGAPLDADLLKLNFMGALSDAKGVYRIALPADTYTVYSIPLSTTTTAPKPEEMLRKLMLRAVRSAKQ
jgi:hypothetical protein